MIDVLEAYGDFHEGKVTWRHVILMLDTITDSIIISFHMKIAKRR